MTKRKAKEDECPRCKGVSFDPHGFDCPLCDGRGVKGFWSYYPSDWRDYRDPLISINGNMGVYLAKQEE